jgi:hypothetical protein
MRHCLRQDYGCHWYLIPVAIEGQFNVALKRVSRHMGDANNLCDMVADFDEQFHDYRVASLHRLTFTNPEENDA